MYKVDELLTSKFRLLNYLFGAQDTDCTWNILESAKPILPDRPITPKCNEGKVIVSCFSEKQIAVRETSTRSISQTLRRYNLHNRTV